MSEQSNCYHNQDEVEAVRIIVTASSTPMLARIYITVMLDHITRPRLNLAEPRPVQTPVAYLPAPKPHRGERPHGGERIAETDVE